MQKDNRLVIVNSFVAEESISPQLRRIRDFDKRHLIYWKNIAVCLATARHFAPNNAELVCLSPDTPPDEVMPLLNRYNVTIARSEFTFRPPEDFHHTFNGSLFRLDAMKWCADNYDNDHDFLFLDPDCVVTDRLGFVGNALVNSDLVSYALPWPPELPNVGVTPIRQAEIAADLSGLCCRDPLPQFGGEFVAMTYEELRRLSESMPDIWKANLNLFFNGRSKFNTEEHLISYYIWRNAPRIHEANGRYIKRFWTGLRYRNVTRGDENLPIWHMPGEKGKGMLAVYDDMVAERICLAAMSNAEIKDYFARRLRLRSAWLSTLCYSALKAVGCGQQGVP